MDELRSRVAAALAAQEYASLGNSLDQAELENLDLFEGAEWPHAVQIMAHIYANNLEDARFVYKRIPDSIKTSSDDIKAAFSLLQRLWVKDYEGMWGAINSYSWPAELQGLVAALRSNLQEHMLLLIQRAYSNISLANLARLLGLSEQDAGQVALQRGWSALDNGLLQPPAVSVHTKLEHNEADLQKLAQYVVYLQSGEAPPPVTSS